MKTISREQRAEKTRIAGVLRDKRDAVVKAIEAYNTARATLVGAIEDAQNEFNEALEEARSFVGDVKSAMDDYSGERTEKWQEGETGQLFGTWQSAWEEISLEDIDVSLPEDIEEVDGEDNIEPFDNLPAGVEDV